MMKNVSLNAPQEKTNTNFEENTLVTPNLSINQERTMISIFVKKGYFTIPLKEVTLEEIEEIRKLQKSKNLDSTLFLFKEYGRYYLALLKPNFSVMATNIYDDVHLCRECAHLSALSDELGGCKKVRHCWKRIERYSFIDVGYQTIKRPSFNPDGSLTCSSEVFCVCKCENFEPDGLRSTGYITVKEKIALCNSLHEFIKDFV